MEIDYKKIDDAVLALLHLTRFEEHDWDALNRLFEKGMISNPKSKAKSIVLTEAGAKRAHELFDTYFRKDK